MSNPTSNFGWQMPTPTDLVTDLPADFEVFGQAVDSDFADLLGGTTGQVLSKTSNTDLDFTWVAANPGDITGVTAGTGISGGGTSGTVTVTNDMATTITASGDIVVGTGSGTYDNLPIGTTGQILTADTSVSPYKVKWAAPAGGGKVLQVIYAATTTETTIATATLTDTTLTATITPSSASSKVMILTVSPIQLTRDSGYQANSHSRLLRGATEIFGWSNTSYSASGGTNPVIPIAQNYLDSPNTTSATTYKVQASVVGSTSASHQIKAQYESSASTMILIEIGA
jgi:hypothetical protein